LSSGIRLDECASLTINDLDFSENRVTVIDGKGGADRVCYFSELAAEWLQLYLTESRPNISNSRSGKGLFLSNKGTHMEKKTLGKTMRDLFDKAGIEGYGCTHRLRHTFTRMLVKSDVNIVSIQTLLGHGSLVTTSRYVNLHCDDVQTDYKKASGF
jgi:integrase/recombinase XerD